MTKPIILGSNSERRKEIFSFFSLPFVQIASDFDENSVGFSGDANEYALCLAQEKAKALAMRFTDHIIITADTVVYFNGKVYNKPVDEEHAFAMLKELSGTWHSVITAVAVEQNGFRIADCQETRILLHTLTDEQIKLYHQSCHFLDRAGAYSIQKGGSIIISQIQGCYYNVMGLPIGTLHTLLLNVGIDLWHHLKSF